jgi:hypothetical protein
MSTNSLWLTQRHEHGIEDYHIFQDHTKDCGPHVVATVVNFWHGRTVLDADTVARAMNRPRMGLGFPPLVIRRIPNWATFPWGIADMLRAHGMRARWRLWAGEERLHRALRESRIVMPIFGEPLRRHGWRLTGWSHVAILVGWDPTENVYWFVDSVQPNVPTSRPRDEFLHLWRNVGRIVVETL